MFDVRCLIRGTESRRESSAWQRFAPGPASRTGSRAGHGAQHRQHGGDRAVHHDSLVSGGDAWAAGLDRLGDRRRSSSCATGWSGANWGRPAGERRVVSFPVARFSVVSVLGPDIPVPIHLAVPRQRHAGDGVGLHRRGELSEIPVSENRGDAN